jgi:hypothetical protein
MMSGFGDVLADALLERTIGQGSQVAVQQVERRNAADDHAMHAKKPARAATATERLWRI